MAKQEKVNENEDVSQKDIMLIAISTVTAVLVSTYYRIPNIFGLSLTTLGIVIIVYLGFSKFLKIGGRIVNIAFRPGLKIITNILEYLVEKFKLKLPRFFKNEKLGTIGALLITLIVFSIFISPIVKSLKPFDLFQAAASILFGGILFLSIVSYLKKMWK